MVKAKAPDQEPSIGILLLRVFVKVESCEESTLGYTFPIAIDPLAVLTGRLDPLIDPVVDHFFQCTTGKTGD